MSEDAVDERLLEPACDPGSFGLKGCGEDEPENASGDEVSNGEGSGEIEGELKMCCEGGNAWCGCEAGTANAERGK